MKKSLLKIGIILILGIILGTTYVHATVTNGNTFGIDAFRTDSSGDRYAYTFQSNLNLKYIWNIQQYNNGIADTNKVFYCLSQGYGDFTNFSAQATVGGTPTTSIGMSPSSYSGPYRLKDIGVLDTLNALYRGTPVVAFNMTRVKALVWMLDNMYIPGQDDKATFLGKIPCVDVGTITGMSGTVQSTIDRLDIGNTEAEISELDILVAQQLALWHYTNNSQVSTFPTIYLSKNGGPLKNYTTTFAGVDPDIDVSYGRIREYFVNMVYNYFIKGGAEAQNSNRNIREDLTTTISVYANAAAQPVVTITREKEVTGNYDIVLKKLDRKGKTLPGAVFTVNNVDYVTGADGTVKIANNVQITENNVGNTDIYTITEKIAPAGYIKYDGSITMRVTKKISTDGLNYIVDNATFDNIDNFFGNVSISKNGNTLTISVIDEEETTNEYLDLALRKFVSKVVDSTGKEVYSKEELADRVPNAITTNLRNGTAKTAQYDHSKRPVKVSVGDKVIYTLRVYNEGNTNAYITQITDYLSKYLKYTESGEWLRQYSQSTTNKYESKATTTTLTTITGASSNLSSLVGQRIGNGILLPAYDRINDKLSYIDVQITCEVLRPVVATGNITGYKITNIAEITGELDKNRNPVLVAGVDIDSIPNNVMFNLPDTEQKWQEYKDNEIGVKSYIPGNQDDDDFEKLIIVDPKYDLALRKFIVQIDNAKVVDENGKYIREPIVDTTSLKQGILQQGYGTATYIHPKKAISVRKGSTITYILRVYNEGNIEAYANEITDHLPEYLDFIKDDEINKKYGWIYDENTRTVKTSITAKSSDDPNGIYAKRKNGKLLTEYTGGDTLDYIDVAIRCKVSSKVTNGDIQTNIAEITNFSDTKGNTVQDLDSTPNKNLLIPSATDLPKYKEELEVNPYVPGQEDDDDYEKVKVEGTFDLALRKFITKVNTSVIDNRYPQVSVDDNGNIKYTHTKTPIDVCTGDTVIYTIRVYNEGEIDGYANEITDDVPEGLEFILDNEINKQYGWVLLDENEQKTDDVSKAKYIVTDYLSEDQAKKTGRDNLIKAFDKNAEINDTNPNYRDVQIAFKVTYKVKEVGEENRVLVNVAQISADSDYDIDSKPSRNEEYDENNHEDDIDYENVKVKYFDLSLLKWVTKAIVEENGKTTVIESGHTGYEKPEPDLKVELKTKDIKKVKVKFAYKIKITNEGEIAGYAKEITDYIPQGLEFRQSDNPDWYVRADGVVATAKLQDKLLQPGESAEVEIILNWINGEKNLGRKINLAEISKDENPNNIPDIDSTPDNKVQGEDDIDDAPVLLVIKTGVGITIQYISLATAIIVILGTGVFAIKKFVL